MNNEPTVILVDCCHGIYAAHNLLQRYGDRLYIDDYEPTPIEKWLKEDNESHSTNETIDSIFNPDNESYCDNIDWLFDRLLILSTSGEYWRVEWREGDIIAVHPDSVWSEEIDGWIMPDNN